jgi:hypothetical protein
MHSQQLSAQDANWRLGMSRTANGAVAYYTACQPDTHPLTQVLLPDLLNQLPGAVQLALLEQLTDLQASEEV